VPFVLAILFWLPTATFAQEDRTRISSSGDTAITAGEHYGAGGLHRFLLGSDYRNLWTTRIVVPILDLSNTGGGLTPTTAGGGLQTKSLRFRGNDGLQYGFRSVDKDPDLLPAGFERTVVERLVQDQISSAHPAGPAITAPLMHAVGILHTLPQLVVLPDDARLGQFRDRFAGTLGFFEERAITEHARPFAGAAEIIEYDELSTMVRSGPENRVDARALLTARLFDLLIGDWDRHPGQWGWARFGDDDVTHWVPVPEDRDQAFVRYDGLFLTLTRIFTPQLANFGDEYPNMLGLTWNGRALDRWLLVELEAQTFDSIASEMQRRLSNEVLEDAVARMPDAYLPVDSARMASALKRRRDSLREAARRFFDFLAEEVDIHATDAAELVEVERDRDNSVSVTIGPLTEGLRSRPYFSRRFLNSETSEIRIYLHGGDDRILIDGENSGIKLRVVGGAGEDLLVDSSGTAGVNFYSDDGDRVEGNAGVKVDRRPFIAPPTAHPNDPPHRDWGSLSRVLPVVGYGPDVGFFVGGSGFRTGYGFRHIPFATSLQFGGGYSAGGQTGRIDIAALLHRSNSDKYLELRARASGIELLRFYGFGNELQLTGPNNNEFYRVNHTQNSIAAKFTMGLSPTVRFSTGPNVQYSRTIRHENRYLAQLPGLYGAGRFGQLGWTARVIADTRDSPDFARRGLLLDFGGGLYPAIWDVDSTYGEVHGVASTYISPARVPLSPTLAMRVGGKKVWGHYPFQNAAYIGDASSVRLGRQNRYGGYAALYGNMELRVRLGRAFLVLPGSLGLFALGDVGRVYYEAESSDRWHNAVGGGVWMSFLGPGKTVSAALVRSEIGTTLPQLTSFYLQGGFAF